MWRAHLVSVQHIHLNFCHIWIHFTYIMGTQDTCLLHLLKGPSIVTLNQQFFLYNLVFISVRYYRVHHLVFPDRENDWWVRRRAQDTCRVWRRLAMTLFYSCKMLFKKIPSLSVIIIISAKFHIHLLVPCIVLSEINLGEFINNHGNNTATCHDNFCSLIKCPLC